MPSRKANCRSSITDRGAAYAKAYHFGRDSPDSLGDFLKDYFAPGGKEYSKENFLPEKPGTHREYSNIAAALAGYIVEVAVGEKLNAYTRRIFFAPLKMDNTGWLLSDVDLAKHSTLYIAQGLAVPIQPYGLTTYPDGGLRTCVSDLSKFFIALLGEGEYQGTRVLDSTSVAEMLRYLYSASNKPDNVKLSGEGAVNSGIFWATKADLTRMGHSGADPGVVTMMIADRSADVAVIFFFNSVFARFKAHKEGKRHDVQGWQQQRRQGKVRLCNAGRPRHLFGGRRATRRRRRWAGRASRKRRRFAPGHR